jgi:hypothetical protein
MGSMFSAPKVRVDEAAIARQQEAERKAAEDAERERRRLEEERRAISLGLRGRRGFLSEAGETGFPAVLGGV